MLSLIIPSPKPHTSILISQDCHFIPIEYVVNANEWITERKRIGRLSFNHPLYATIAALYTVYLSTT